MATILAAGILIIWYLVKLKLLFVANPGLSIETRSEEEIARDRIAHEHESWKGFGKEDCAGKTQQEIEKMIERKQARADEAFNNWLSYNKRGWVHKAEEEYETYKHAKYEIEGMKECLKN